MSFAAKGLIRKALDLRAAMTSNSGSGAPPSEFMLLTMVRMLAKLQGYDKLKQARELRAAWTSSSGIGGVNSDLHACCLNSNPSDRSPREKAIPLLEVESACHFRLRCGTHETRVIGLASSNWASAFNSEGAYFGVIAAGSDQACR